MPKLYYTFLTELQQVLRFSISSFQINISINKVKKINIPYQTNKTLTICVWVYKDGYI